MARALSVLFAAAPFLFGAFRAVRGGDLRMLWMAAASGLGALAIRMLARGLRQPVQYAVATLFLTTMLAGITATALGATAPFGIWAVAIVLGGCWTASYVLGAIARAHR